MQVMCSPCCALLSLAPSLGQRIGVIPGYISSTPPPPAGWIGRPSHPPWWGQERKFWSNNRLHLGWRTHRSALSPLSSGVRASGCLLQGCPPWHPPCRSIFNYSRNGVSVELRRLVPECQEQTRRQKVNSLPRPVLSPSVSQNSSSECSAWRGAGDPASVRQPAGAQR